MNISWGGKGSERHQSFFAILRPLGFYPYAECQFSHPNFDSEEGEQVVFDLSAMESVESIVPKIFNAGYVFGRESKAREVERVIGERVEEYRF